MTPAQCRAARALIEITQGQLATEASVGLSTIVDLEKQRRQVSDSAVADIRAALERKGVEFIPEDPGGGAGVRLAKKALGG